MQGGLEGQTLENIGFTKQNHCLLVKILVLLSKTYVFNKIAKNLQKTKKINKTNKTTVFHKSLSSVE